MTSKISFFKLLKQDMRHRFWVPVLAGIVFLVGLVAYTLYIQGISVYLFHGDLPADTIARQSSRAVGPLIVGKGNPLLGFCAAVGAVICGLSGFYSLFSRRESDFYLSLPIRRRTLFLVRYVNGLLFYLVPYLAFLVLAAVSATIFGFPGGELILNGLVGMFYHSLCFLLFYHTIILACILCGQIVVALMVFVAIMGYGYIFGALVPVYFSNYYSTYQTVAGGFWSIFFRLSPAWSIFNLYAEEAPGCAVFLVLLLFALCLGLYIRRDSENSGSAMAFPKLTPVLQVLLLVPAVLYTALVFGEVAGASDGVWSIIGLGLSLVIGHGFLQALFSLNLKKAFRRLPQLALCAVFTLVFLLFFIIDPLKMDSRYPSMASVDKVYISLPLRSNYDCFDPETGKHMDRDAYSLKYTYLTGEELPLAYDLIKASSANRQEYEDYYSNIDRDDLSYSIERYSVRFVKKNGQSQTRWFYMALPDMIPQVQAVYDCSTYRENLFALGNLKDFDAEYTIQLDGYYGETIWNTSGMDQISQEEIYELAELMNEELSAMTFAQRAAAQSAGQILLRGEGRDSYVTTTCVPLYKDMTKTLSWLKDRGVDPMDLSALKDRGLELIVYRDGYSMVQITDTDRILELLPRLYLNSVGVYPMISELAETDLSGADEMLEAELVIRTKKADETDGTVDAAYDTVSSCSYYWPKDLPLYQQ